MTDGDCECNPSLATKVQTLLPFVPRCQINDSNHRAERYPAVSYTYVLCMLCTGEEEKGRIQGNQVNILKLAIGMEP